MFEQNTAHGSNEGEKRGDRGVSVGHIGLLGETTSIVDISVVINHLRHCAQNKALLGLWQ